MIEPKVLAIASFADSCELEDLLYDWKQRADGEEKDSGVWPFIHVEDSNGNELTHGRLIESTLTDGSKVYKVVLEGAPA